MNSKHLPRNLENNVRLAIDIGSTVIKVAKIDRQDKLLKQDFYERDAESGITGQIKDIFARNGHAENDGEVLVCSSANGGLRVGIVCLTPHYSGTVLRNQVLSAGANPIFAHDLCQATGDPRFVDILLVGGGINCADLGALQERFEQFSPEKYRFGALMYAGNIYLQNMFTQRHKATILVENPLGQDLAGKKNSVFKALRNAYLDDLVYKEGISELGRYIAGPIRPTPEVVNRGFHRAICNRSDINVGGASVLIDIGGATTDLHYSVEIIRDDSENRPLAGSSVARYVFTDLGVVASYDSTLRQLRSHPRTIEFLNRVFQGDVSDTYRLLREDDYDATVELMAYACLFLALDRFSRGKGPGLPAADFRKISRIVLTGGATQSLDEDKIIRIVNLFMTETKDRQMILVDRRYQIWTDGITWPVNLSMLG